MVIKSVLREELQNSLRMKKQYERELAKLPKGSLVKRIIKGHEYYYLVYRENGKFKSIYKGKSVTKRELKKYQDAKELRAKYRHSLSKLKRQIRYLEGALRGKEEI
jgi:U3 small nucleolar RNA-associated protein 14